MEQTKLKQTVMDFLNTQHKAVFGVLDDMGLPTTSLMLYVIDDEMNVYFGTRKLFSKYEYLRSRPIVSLSVVEGVADPLKVVDIRGAVEELSPAAQEKAYALMKEKNPAQYFIEEAEDFVMFKLTPEFVRWLDGEGGELSITHWAV